MERLGCFVDGSVKLVTYSLNKDELAKVNAYFNESFTECRLNFGWFDGELSHDCVQVMSDDMDSNFDSTVDEIASIINIDAVYSEEV